MNRRSRLCPSSGRQLACFYQARLHIAGHLWHMVNRFLRSQYASRSYGGGVYMTNRRLEAT